MSDYTLDPSFYDPVCEGYPAGIDLVTSSESEYFELRKALEGIEASDGVSSADEAAWKLAWQSEFQDFLEVSEAKPPIYSGRDIIRPAIDPDWGAVWERGQELLVLTKDMRLMAGLLLAGLSTGGPARMAEVCDYILKTVNDYWDSFLPPAEDGDDHYERIKPLKEALEGPRFSKAFSTAVLFRSARIGDITSRFTEVALDGSLKAENEFVLDREGFEQFLKDEPAAAEGLTIAAQAALASAKMLTEIEAAINSHPGSFSIKAASAVEALQRLASRLNSLGITTEQKAPDDTGPEYKAGEKGPQTASNAPEDLNVGRLGSKAEALGTIRAVKMYLTDEVPSSPLALLLEQVEVMFGASFPDLVRLVAQESTADPMLVVNIDDTAQVAIPLGTARQQAEQALDDLASILEEMGDSRLGGREPLQSMVGRGQGALDALRSAIKIELRASQLVVIDSHSKAREALINVAGFMERAEPSHPSALFLHAIAALIGENFANLLRELMPQGAHAIKLGLALPTENDH